MMNISQSVMKLTQVLETSQGSDPAECSTEWTEIGKWALLTFECVSEELWKQVLACKKLKHQSFCNYSLQIFSKYLFFSVYTQLWFVLLTSLGGL